MCNQRIGVELFGLGYERKVFERQTFTTSYARVAEHIYRALLFHSPEEWELTIFAADRWRHGKSEEASFRRHHGQVQTFFRPHSFPLVDPWIGRPWRDWLKRKRYIPNARAKQLSLLQFTSGWPWANSPISTGDVVLAADFYPERTDGNRLCKTIERFKYRRDNLWMVAISEFTKQDALSIAQIPPGRVKAIPLAVDHAVYQPIQTDDDQFTRTRLGVPLRYVLYVGNLSDRKNVLTLVRAMELLNSRSAGNDPITLILAGNVAAANFRQRHKIWGEIRKTLKRTPIKQISYPNDSEMASLYRGALLVAHPSEFEGFGFTVLEALACGTPVICGRHSSLVEVGGKAARFVENVHSTEEFTSALEEVVASAALRQSMRSLGIQHASAFQWETFERQIVATYDQILNGQDI